MNKAFKVLWNHLRGSYVVASEATASHGKASKAVKTAVAVAAMAAMVGGVQAADPITNDSFGSGEGQYDSTKFISGNGETLTIQTNGNVSALLTAIKNKDLNAIRAALGFVKDETTGNTFATLVGTAGGATWVDYGVAGIGDYVGGLLRTEALENLSTLDKGTQSPISVLGGTEIIIGSVESEETTGSEPLLVLTTGGDRVLKAGSTNSPFAEQG